ncbi:MAG: DUF2997 domain-containing protein [Patescibacteria group bacterium]|nr:DUF2997 domain-containing protein [Patescibacteria group bacterium]
MNQPKSIVIEVAEDGAVKVEGHGFSGPDCQKATAFLESALGVKTGEVRKPEFIQKAVNVQRTTQR